MPFPALGECGADKRRIGDACPAYREGCNGRVNSPLLVEAFPTLAKVGTEGQKATRRAVFVLQCTPCHLHKARGLPVNFFCAVFSALCRGIRAALAAVFMYKSNSGFNLLRQGGGDRDLRDGAAQDAAIEVWAAAAVFAD